MNIYGLGANSGGQLGNGNFEDQGSLQKLNLPADFLGPPRKVACGGNHTMLIDQNNNVFCCGDNKKSQLSSFFESKAFSTPSKLKHEEVIDVGTGFEHSLLVTSDGNITGFGQNNFGQLGSASFYLKRTKPSKFIKISCGPRTTRAITSDGEVWGWGNREDPAKVENISTATEVCAGFYHTIILAEGKVYTYGKNQYGQLGVEELDKKTEPYLISLEEEAIDIKCGWHHSLVLTSLGNVYGWGRNNHCQLGLPSESIIRKPLLIPISEKVIKIACGAEHSIALTSNNQVYVWGWNEHGNCGLPSSIIDHPTLLPDIPGIPEEIYAGYGFTLLRCS